MLLTFLWHSVSSAQKHVKQSTRRYTTNVNGVPPLKRLIKGISSSIQRFKLTNSCTFPDIPSTMEGWSMPVFRRYQLSFWCLMNNSSIFNCSYMPILPLRFTNLSNGLIRVHEACYLQRHDDCDVSSSTPKPELTPIPSMHDTQRL